MKQIQNVKEITYLAPPHKGDQPTLIIQYLFSRTLHIYYLLIKDFWVPTTS